MPIAILGLSSSGDMPEVLMPTMQRQSCLRHHARGSPKLHAVPYAPHDEAWQLHAEGG